MFKNFVEPSSFELIGMTSTDKEVEKVETGKRRMFVNFLPFDVAEAHNPSERLKSKLVVLSSFRTY